MESTALFRRDFGCARKKFEVYSVQWLTSGHFKCAHLETFQKESPSSEVTGKFLVPYQYS